MRKEMYPAIFSSDGNGGYTISFPDLLGCVTEGDTLAEAVEMAEDALGLYLYSLSEDKERLYNKCWGDTTTVSLPTLFFCKK